MNSGFDNDQIMEDGHTFHIEDIVTTTEMNGSPPTTLDPSKLGINAMSNVVQDVRSYSNRAFDHFEDHKSIKDGSHPMKRSKDLVAVKAPKYGALPYATSRTGLVYDVRMRFHVEPRPREEDMHPEDPRRIWSVYMELAQAGLVDDPHIEGPAADYVLGRIEASLATRKEVCAVHTERLYDWVMGLAGKSLTLANT